MVNRVKKLVSGRRVTVFALLVFALSPSSLGQIRGVPASVTSIDFGGRNNPTPGVPASVTSLGPNGFGHSAGNALKTCCVSPFFPVSTNPPVFRGRHHHRNFIPIAVPYFAPTYTPVIVVQQPYMAAPDEEEDDVAGPTIFDRRGSDVDRPRKQPIQKRDEEERDEQDASPAPTVAKPIEVPVADQPQTVLVFKDGHRSEVRNYAIVGETLYDFTEARRKIALADLDLPATMKENDDRGLDFKVPANFAP